MAISSLWCYVFINKVARYTIYHFLFGFVFCTTLPFLGNLLLIIIIPFLKFTKKTKTKIRLHKIEYPEFQNESDQVAKIKNEGIWGAKLKLESEESSIAEKIRALSILNSTFIPAIIKINQEALHQLNDEVRLYAFSLLNTKQTQIELRIGVMLKQAASNQDSFQKAIIEKGLAELYWELIYYNFISHDLLDFTLSKALRYGLSAIKSFPHDASLWVLLGKIYSRQKKFDESINAFNRAIELKAPSHRVKPYLAEIYFKKKAYDLVKKSLNDDDLTSITALKGIINFWNRKEFAKRNEH